MIYYCTAPVRQYTSLMATKLARLDPNPAGSVIDLPPRSGSIIQIYGSADLHDSIKNIYRSGKLRSKYFNFIW